ncbi:Medium/long-chain-fatty-acid--[acyl-carrier-protein] ligase MbtM, partial [Frankliniella fusca]
MKDPRGVERRACKNCKCTAYELEAGATRAACSYCECPPTPHHATGVMETSNSSSNTSKEANISPNSSIVETVT